MPRETIHAKEIDVHIQWTTDRDLHVATVIPDESIDGVLPDLDPGYLRVIEEVNGWLREAKMPTVDPVKLAEGLHLRPHFAGWYAELDRRGVQRMIEVLRRARNQVFGADV